MPPASTAALAAPPAASSDWKLEIMPITVPSRPSSGAESAITSSDRSWLERRVRASAPRASACAAARSAGRPAARSAIRPVATRSAGRSAPASAASAAARSPRAQASAAARRAAPPPAAGTICSVFDAISASETSERTISSQPTGPAAAAQSRIPPSSASPPTGRPRSVGQRRGGARGERGLGPAVECPAVRRRAGRDVVHDDLPDAVAGEIGELEDLERGAVRRQRRGLYRQQTVDDAVGVEDREAELVGRDRAPEAVAEQEVGAAAALDGLELVEFDRQALRPLLRGGGREGQGGERRREGGLAERHGRLLLAPRRRGLRFVRRAGAAFRFVRRAGAAFRFVRRAGAAFRFVRRAGAAGGLQGSKRRTFPPVSSSQRKTSTAPAKSAARLAGERAGRAARITRGS